MKALRCSLSRSDYEGAANQGIVNMAVIGSGKNARFVISFGPPGLAATGNCAYIRNFLKAALRRLEKK
jgi:hypothetical protein